MDQDIENKTQQNIPSAQPASPVPNQSINNWGKIVLLVLLGLIIIGGSIFAGIQIGKHQTTDQQQVAEKPTTNPTQPVANQITKLPETTPTTISTKDWKTFSSNTEGFTIKYPNDWNIENSSDGNCGHAELNGSTCRDRYDFVSPDQIRVRYVIHRDDNIDKISCGQQSYCEGQNVLEMEKLNIPNFGQVELVKLEREVRLHKPISAATTPIVGENKHDDFMIDFNLPSKTGGRYSLFITTTTAGYEPTWLKDITTEQFYNVESVKEGIEILKSLSY